MEHPNGYHINKWNTLLEALHWHVNGNAYDLSKTTQKF